MKSLRTATTSTTGLTSILLVYLILISVVLIFARQVIRDASLETPITNVIVIPLAVLLPLLMLIAIGIYAARLVREHRAGRAGARLKTRFMIVFSIITLISSIPQAVLSMSVIEIAMSRWFSSPAAEGLEAGVDLVLQYNLEKIDGLRAFGSSPLYSDALRDIERAPDLVWNRVSATIPGVDAMQIFSREKGEIGFYGDDRAHTSFAVVATRTEGLLPKEIYLEYSAIRYLRSIRSAGEEYLVVVSSIVPKEFDRKAEKLTEASDTFNQIQLFRPMFRIVIAILYSLFSLPLVLLSILVSFLLAEELIRPIASLEAATRRVAEGDFSYRILGRGVHELASLVRSFNSMVTELERSRNKLMQTEKVAAWQEIAQRMAHEIKNPLTPIKLNAQRILTRFRIDPAEMDRILEPAIGSIVNEVDNLNDLLQEFRDFARLPTPKIEPIHLSELVDEVLSIYAGVQPRSRTDLSKLDKDITVPADRDQLKRVLSNLIKNAFEAIREDGAVTITSDLVRKSNSNYCRIQIKDTGSGIEPEYHNRVFNPYFTTKEGGTGLGLPIVERIIFDHKGQIWFETEAGIGTTFFIDLPMEAE